MHAGFFPVDDKTGGLDCADEAGPQDPAGADSPVTFGERSGELLLISRESEVIRVAGIGDAMLPRQSSERNVEEMGEQVGDDRGAWAALRQRVLVTGDLGDDRGSYGVNCCYRLP